MRPARLHLTSASAVFPSNLISRLLLSCFRPGTQQTFVDATRDGPHGRSRDARGAKLRTVDLHEILLQAEREGRGRGASAGGSVYYGSGVGRAVQANLLLDPSVSGMHRGLPSSRVGVVVMRDPYRLIKYIAGIARQFSRDLPHNLVLVSWTVGTSDRRDEYDFVGDSAA